MAKTHMKAQRFAEAIDLLNKFISSNPQNAEGYYLRGVSYKNRYQFENASLDVKRAIKLSPDNKKYHEELENIKKVWYAQLKKKIKGHEREIAIDPNVATNYLEIGQSYKKMEEFILAEEWYDKYLARDDNASPDEIIRYTEILAKNKHIKKGEIILKKWVERYPSDWRLWSRYGTFNLWLGNRKVAQQAFETALGFKPYFQEALDGLDKAKLQAYVTDYDQKSYEKEFIVDKLIRNVKENPKNVDLRFKLIDELLKHNRLEEAYEQVVYLELNHSDDKRFQAIYDKVVETRKKVYTEGVDKNLELLSKNPKNLSALKNVVSYYENLQDFDEALELLGNHFEKFPEEDDQDLRFSYARIAAWNKDFDLSAGLLDGLIKENPTNLKYLFLRAQIMVWTNQDIATAEEYLNKVLQSEPQNINAIITMGSLQLLKQDPATAQIYANKAKEIEANNNDLGELQTQIDLLEQRLEQERLQAILDEGRKFVLDSNCTEALGYYEKYFTEAQPNDFVLKEFGDVQFCAKQYDEAISTYDKVLSHGYMYEAALQRAKVLFVAGDSIEAVAAFKEVVEQDSAEFEPRLYLGDALIKVKDYDSARAVYDTLMTWDLDSTQTKLVQYRYGWIPATGFWALVETFPSSIGLAPIASFYSDNASFSMQNYGARLEFGALSWLALGVGMNKFTLNGSSGFRDYLLFNGSAIIWLKQNLRLIFNFGSLATADYKNQDDYEGYAIYEVPNKLYLEGYYLNRDASLVLFSPGLIHTARLSSELFRITGRYVHKSSFRMKGYFQYLTVSDGNEGNNSQLRIGKMFDEIEAGYEYYYANYKYDRSLYTDSTVLVTGEPYYYSPQNFVTHSIYADYSFEEGDDWDITIGGKVGYAPTSGFMIFEGYGKAQYKPFEKMIITAELRTGNSTRDVSNYRSYSGVITAYWNLFP